jgi:hypothetical protein
MSTLVSEAIIRASRGTAAAWTSADPVLEAGEWGYESDTGKTKIGDGSTAWTSLEYTPTKSDVDAKLTGSTDQIAKAWVNFNGTGTVAIRDSYNVSSITDNGVGDYDINFTNNMSDANYSASFGANYPGAENSVTFGEKTILDRAVGYIGTNCIVNTSLADLSSLSVQIFGT